MEYVQLLGADDIRSAGIRMQNAADDMIRVEGYFEEALQRHEQFLDEWLERFADTLKEKE